MAHLLAQPQQKIAARLSNKNCQESSNNQAEWKSDTKELKKPHSSRWVGGKRRGDTQSVVEMWRHRTNVPTPTCGR